MRLLVISPTFPPLKCGVGDYTYFLSTAWADKGHEVIVLTSKEVYTHNTKTGLLKPYNAITSWRVWNLFKIVRKIREIDPHFINIQYEPGAYEEKTAVNWLPLLCKIFLPDIPVFTTFHAYNGPARFSRLNLMVMSLFSDRLIVTNEVDYHKIAKRVRFWINKTCQIPIGANLDFSLLNTRTRAELKRKWQIAKDDFVLCFFGFILPGKGLDKLIEAVRLLKQKQKTIKLLIIGGNSRVKNEVSIALEKTLKHQAEEGKISDDVIWTGYLEREEVSHLLQISKLGVFLYQDGISLRRGSLVAAITHFLPIISSFNDLLPDFLINGENIILTSYDSIPELVAKIELYMANPDKLQAVRRALKKIAPQFEWKTISDRYIEEYIKVGKNHEPF